MRRHGRPPRDPLHRGPHRVGRHMRLRHHGSLLLLVALPLAAAPLLLSAQEPLERARQLQAEGQFSAAADTVRVYLRSHPDDPAAHWMWGQLLHWTGEHRAAREAYEEARGLGLDDPWMDLEYGSVLLALGEWEEAREIFRAVVDDAPRGPRIEALALLGTLAYGQGDLETAAGHLEAVLDEDPDHDEARRQLREVRALTRPWIRSRLELMTDNQPYQRYRLALEGGAFVTPLWSLGAGGTPRITDTGATEASGDAWAELRGLLLGPGLDLSVRAGGAWAGRSTRGESTWTGRTALALRLPASLKLGASVERDRYLWTRTSADTLLMAEALELALDRSEAPGWAGKAGLRHESFPDDNSVRAAYAWILAPVQPWLRVGYAFSWSDAEETTWTADPTADPTGPGRPGGPGGPGGAGAVTVPGHYDPYFTPEDTRIHTLLAELSGSAGAGTARLSGAWGLAAREDAPVLTESTTGPPTLGFLERDYTPWSLTASWTAPVTGSVTLDVRAERNRTAFYRLTHLEAGIVYRFLPGTTPRR